MGRTKKTNAELTHDIFEASKKLTALLNAREIEHVKCKVTTPAGDEAYSTTQECFNLGIEIPDAKWDLIKACETYTKD